MFRRNKVFVFFPCSIQQHPGYYPQPIKRQKRAQVPLPRRLTRPEEVILQKLSPELVGEILLIADYLFSIKLNRLLLIRYDDVSLHFEFRTNLNSVIF